MNKEEIRRKLADIDEVIDDGRARTLLWDLIEDIIDPQNPYCDKCGACGEELCCDPTKCEQVQCKYGKGYLQSYDSLLKEVGKFDWQKDFPSPTLRCGHKYLWMTLDPDDRDIEMVGLCEVWILQDAQGKYGYEWQYKYENRHFYTINDIRYVMKFIGYPPMLFNGEPVFDYIAKINHPTWEGTNEY